VINCGKRIMTLLAVVLATSVAIQQAAICNSNSKAATVAAALQSTCCTARPRFRNMKKHLGLWGDSSKWLKWLKASAGKAIATVFGTMAASLQQLLPCC